MSDFDNLILVVLKAFKETVGMFNLLEKLRTKSRAQRTFIAFSISLLFTGTVFVTWLVAEKNTQYAHVETNTTTEGNTPTDTLVRNIATVWQSVSGTMKNAQQIVKDTNFSSTIEYTSATSTSSDVATSTP